MEEGPEGGEATRTGSTVELTAQPPEPHPDQRIGRSDLGALVGSLAVSQIPSFAARRPAAAMIAVPAWSAVRRWHALGTGERGVVVVIGLLWLTPLIIGGELSLHRAESLLVPVLVIMLHVRARVVAGLALVASVIAVAMARLFFLEVLV